MHKRAEICKFANKQHRLRMENPSNKPEVTPPRNIFVRVARFYIDGFRNMTVGKTLWSIILIKLFIMFAILKLFFFPDFLASKSNDDKGKAEYVRTELTNRN